MMHPKSKPYEECWNQVYFTSPVILCGIERTVLNDVNFFRLEIHTFEDGSKVKGLVQDKETACLDGNHDRAKKHDAL